MVLIVDDIPENIYSLKKLLELNGFSVDTALSEEEALKKILKKFILPDHTRCTDAWYGRFRGC